MKVEIKNHNFLFILFTIIDAAFQE